LWIDKMGLVDGSGVLPVVGGLVAMINAELVGRRNRGIERALVVEEDGAGQGKGDDVKNGPSEKEGKVAVERPSVEIVLPRRETSALPSGLQREVLAPKTIPSGSSSSRSLSTTSTVLALPRPRAVKKRPAQASRPVPTSGPSQPSPRTAGAARPEHLTSMGDPSALSAREEKNELRSKIMTNAMRVGAVCFIPIASHVPAVSCHKGTIEGGAERG
jgi:inner membrane protein COX18